MTADNLTALLEPAGFVARKDESHGMRSLVRGVDPAARYEYDNDGWQTESLYTEQQVRALLAARDAERGELEGVYAPRYVADGPEGMFGTDSMEFAEAIIRKSLYPDDWTVTDTHDPDLAHIDAALQADTARAEGE